MRRGRAGIGAHQQKQRREEKLKNLGKQIEEAQLEHVKGNLATFQTKLEDFATKYKKKINDNPLFRTQFQEMCQAIGVDPLASNKGFWGELLGFGDFYYELGVQIIDICFQTRRANGGLINEAELLTRLRKQRRATAQQICEDDIERAVKKLAAFGDGFRLIKVGSAKMVVSVPVELNQDHMAVLAHAENTAHSSLSQIKRDLRWSEARASSVLDLMLQEGMAWIDNQTGGEPDYWFPSLFRRKP